METQPELEPSAAASVRSPRSMETTPERNVRSRTDSVEAGSSAAGAVPTPEAPTPPGGWQAAETYGLQNY